jgi:uncharacterized protein (DUF736 family)
MATIGTFAKTNDGFKGKITTFTVRATASFEPTGLLGKKAPSYRLVIAGAEAGAAWIKASDAGKQYLSVKIDDPAFPAPVWANLTEQPDAAPPSSGPASACPARTDTNPTMPAPQRRRRTNEIQLQDRARMPPRALLALRYSTGMKAATHISRPQRARI